jgi:hypothetical protein
VEKMRHEPDRGQEGTLPHLEGELEEGGCEPDKTVEIVEACASGDLMALKRLAESEGGLLHDRLRRRACSLLWPSPCALFSH